MGGGAYNTSSNFFQQREGREQPMSAMTITHGVSPDGLPAMGDYISEDFLQILEVFISYLKRIFQEYLKVCEREGKFNEAQTARKRLKELRRLEEHRKRESLVQRHVIYHLKTHSFFSKQK